MSQSINMKYWIQVVLHVTMLSLLVESKTFLGFQGINRYGLFGNGDTSTSSESYILNTGTLLGKNLTKVVGGNDHILVLDAQGKVYASGGNTLGQLTDGTTIHRSTFQEITSLPSSCKLKDIEAGNWNNFFLCEDQSIYASGSNLYYELGIGGENHYSTPVQILTSGPLIYTDLIQMYVKQISTFFRTSSGKIYASGKADTGQLGIGDKPAHFNPTEVVSDGALQGKTIIQIAIGFQHTLFLDDNGDVYGTGTNSYKCLGNLPTKLYEPEQLTPGILSTKKIKFVAAGINHSFFLSEDGIVYGIGLGIAGAFGAGSLGLTLVDTPLAMNMSGALAGKEISYLEVGTHPFLVDTDNRVYTTSSDTSNFPEVFRLFPNAISLTNYLGLGGALVGIIEVNCEEGQYRRDTLNCTTCPIGSYCPDRESLVPCFSTSTPNHYSDSEGSNSCKVCGEGYYISHIGEECSICPKGSYCPGDGKIFTCSNGNYSDSEGLSSCNLCTGGFTIEETDGEGNIICTPCPIGSFCTGDGKVSQCNDTTFSDAEGLTFCKTCNAGSYTSEREVGEGNSQCTPCPVGSYCPDGDAIYYCTGTNYTSTFAQESCSGCDIGKYVVKIESGEGNSLCLDCPIGSFCPGDGTSSKCTGMNYSDSIGLASCKSCSTGYYISEDAHGEGNSACSPCPGGSYCPNGEVKYSCEGNSYSDAIGQSSCATCPSGNFTYENETGKGNTNCEYCALGSYCSGDGTMLKCAGMNYSDSIGLESCKICSSGKYTTEVNEGEGNTDCISCPRGFYCIDGNNATACNNGEYTESDGSSNYTFCASIFCPSGYDCIQGILFEVSPPNSTWVIIVVIPLAILVIIVTIVILIVAITTIIVKRVYISNRSPKEFKYDSSEVWKVSSKHTSIGVEDNSTAV